MRKHILSIIFISSTLFTTAKAQVGINTATPTSTLDVTAKNTTGTTTNVDGLLVPRVDRQRAQSMTGVPTSTLIYVNSISTGTLSGTAVNIDALGYYYYNGSVWTKLNTDLSAWKLTGNTATNPGTNAIGLATDGNFIGTTDTQNLVLGTGSIKRFIIDNNSNAFGGANGSAVAIATNNGGNNRNFIWGNNSKIADPTNLGNANSNVIFGANNIINAGGLGFGSTNIVTGGSNTVSSSSSAVFGGSNTVTGGLYNMVSGQSNTLASGGSVIFGIGNNGSGNISAAIGQGLKTPSSNEFNTGRFNTFTTGDALNWIATDPLVQVGAGTNDATRQNALTILKNGNTAIGFHTTAPASTLDVRGNARVSTRTGTANTILGVDTATGQLTDVTLGTGLSLSSGTLNATATSVATAEVASTSGATFNVNNLGYTTVTGTPQSIVIPTGGKALFINFMLGIDYTSTPTGGGASFYEARLFIDNVATNVFLRTQEPTTQAQTQYTLSSVKFLSEGSHDIDVRMIRSGGATTSGQNMTCNPISMSFNASYLN
ncbi:hypothetical protein GCM10022217_41200 [Chryseobacterium ginsenosidimutans]|uniref:beta strand repeat-containing protein n=1 Tax=Chryseobacterium ginsenosidimutans TaxID=687846 RepID=UPI0031DBD85B